jgi:hypothetical protein
MTDQPELLKKHISERDEIPRKPPGPPPPTRLSPARHRRNQSNLLPHSLNRRKRNLAVQRSDRSKSLHLRRREGYHGLAEQDYRAVSDGQHAFV